MELSRFAREVEKLIKKSESEDMYEILFKALNKIEKDTSARALKVVSTLLVNSKKMGEIIEDAKKLKKYLKSDKEEVSKKIKTLFDKIDDLSRGG